MAAAPARLTKGQAQKLNDEAQEIRSDEVRLARKRSVHQDRIRTHHARGVPASAIAAAVGVSKQRVLAITKAGES